MQNQPAAGATRLMARDYALFVVKMVAIYAQPARPFDKESRWILADRQTAVSAVKTRTRCAKELQRSVRCPRTAMLCQSAGVSCPLHRFCPDSPDFGLNRTSTSRCGGIALNRGERPTRLGARHHPPEAPRPRTGAWGSTRKVARYREASLVLPQRPQSWPRPR